MLEGGIGGLVKQNSLETLMRQPSFNTGLVGGQLNDNFLMMED